MDRSDASLAPEELTAAKKRELATKARRIADQIFDERAIHSLLDLARDFEQQAAEMEIASRSAKGAFAGRH